jgi:hypothetical protein
LPYPNQNSSLLPFGIATPLLFPFGLLFSLRPAKLGKKASVASKASEASVAIPKGRGPYLLRKRPSKEAEPFPLGYLQRKPFPSGCKFAKGLLRSPFFFPYPKGLLFCLTPYEVSRGNAKKEGYEVSKKGAPSYFVRQSNEGDIIPLLKIILRLIIEESNYYAIMFSFLSKLFKYLLLIKMAPLGPVLFA